MEVGGVDIEDLAQVRQLGGLFVLQGGDNLPLGHRPPGLLWADPGAAGNADDYVNGSPED